MTRKTCCSLFNIPPPPARQQMTFGETRAMSDRLRLRGSATVEDEFPERPRGRGRP
jgi:hypothetical protein